MKNKYSVRAMASDVVKKNKLLAVILGAAIAGSIAAVLLPPLVLERIIDRLTMGREIAAGEVIVYFALIVLSGIFDAAEEVLIVTYGQKVTHRIRSEMCSKLTRLPAGYFADNEPGDISSRFVNDVDAVDRLFTSGVISMAADMFKVLSIMAVIYVKSTGLGILILMAVPVIFALTRCFQKRMLDAQITNRHAVGHANSMIPETIRNIRLIHSLGKEEYMAGRYDERIQQSYRALEKSNFYDAIYSPIVINISTILIALMMVLCAGDGRMQEFFGMSVGSAVAVISYVGRVFEPIESIGMEIQNIQSALSGLHRISEFMQEPERKFPEKEGRNVCVEDGNIPAVELQGVSFGYEEGSPVLKDFSLNVAAGEHVTLRGRTGSGKSTVFRLIMGHYEPWCGNVRIFGIEPELIPDGDRRKLIGYVEQQFRIIPGTVMDQITLKDTQISGVDAVKAAELAGIHEMISTLPEGYDTTCDRSMFSQGQLQLLAIARAVAADPSVLLLDEITANLDSETEKEVMNALQAASRDRTVISISHRLFIGDESRRVTMQEKQ